MNGLNELTGIMRSEHTKDMTDEELKGLEAKILAMTDEELKEFRCCHDPDAMGFWGEEVPGNGSED